MAGATASLFAAGAFAQELAETPKFTEGPFYPDRLPLDTDNDLLLLNDSITPAIGQITHLTGRVLSNSGSPIRNAFVEIWQCDQNGAYLHSGTSNKDRRDLNFQGYGRFLTDSKGQYYFRTIKPVAYPGRTPHIHVAVSQHGQRILTTQMFVSGYEQNLKDGLYRSIKDDQARKNVTIDFTPIADSKIQELSAHFEIVLGATPVESADGQLLGLPQRSKG
ncbi:MAG: intradiol ring-cleavage dioxygenase [Pirellulaceae bacterium]|nr:intradiol ring-cleavage dioxygenase [Pirellulaceae bacterium]